MGLPRMREEQVAALNNCNQQIIKEVKIPKFCNEICKEYNPSCAVAWILETVLETNRIDERQIYDDLQIRHLNSKIRLVPHLMNIAVACEESIVSKSGPTEVGIASLIVRVKPSNSPDVA